jgi:uncharacterized protein involved in exopolysaccharide biosynthesis
MAGGAAVAFVWSHSIPNKYEAEVEIEIDQSATAPAMATSPQEATVIDYLNFTHSRSMVTQVAQLGSMGVVTAAANKVAAAHGRSHPENDPNDELNPTNLMRDLSISSDQGSDILSMRLRMLNPQLAEEVIQEIYLAFVAQNQENARALAARAMNSLQTQSGSVDKQLTAIDNKMSDLRQKTGFPDVAGQIQSEIQGLKDLKQARDAAAIEAAGAHSSAEVLTRELATMPKNLQTSNTTASNPVWERLQSDLFTAKSERDTLLGRYLPDNDLVKAADAKIRGIENGLKELKQSTPAQTSSGLNPNYMQLQVQLSTAKATADAADQKLVAANAEIAQREKYLATLPPIQNELTTLGRQQATLERVYAGYQDELKTIQASKVGRSSLAQEISPAYADPQPVSPKPKVNTLFGALVGLLFGIATVMLRENRRQPVRTLAQLNGLALNPVYRLIPELRVPFRGVDKAPPEAYESLLANYLRDPNRPYRIAVVGVNKDSGASTTALNLAIAGARHGSHVLLAECENKGALSKAGVREMPKAGELVQLSHLISGIFTENVLAGNDYEGGLSSAILANEGDLTVIDLEPAAKSAEYAFVAPYVNEVILLVRAGRARSVEFLQVQQALRDAGCPRVTVVFTRASDFSVVIEGVDGDVEEHQPIAAPVRVVAARALPTIRMEEVEEEPVVVKAASKPKRPARKPTPKVTRATNGTVPHEGPVQRTRTAPSVTIEDFGGISRAKAPEASVATAAPKAPRTRSRVDTSDIDS